MYFFSFASLLLTGLATASPILESNQTPSHALERRQNPNAVTWYAANNNQFTASSDPQVWVGNANQNFAVWFQTDGNLVDYETEGGRTEPLWQAGTGGRDCSGSNHCIAIFQDDGNFVIYMNSEAIWDTATTGKGYVLYMRPNGAPYIFIEDSSGNVLWEAVKPATGPPGCPPDRKRGEGGSHVICN